MKITGLKVKAVLELENGFSSVVLEDGTQIVTKIIIPGSGAAAAEADEDDEPEEKPAAKPAAKKPAAKPEPEEKDELTWEDLKGMDEDELKDYIDEEGLDTDADDYEDDLPGLRKAIAKEQGIEIPKKK
jgi:hypothetical protein